MKQTNGHAEYLSREASNAYLYKPLAGEVKVISIMFTQSSPALQMICGEMLERHLCFFGSWIVTAIFCCRKTPKQWHRTFQMKVARLLVKIRRRQLAVILLVPVPCGDAAGQDGLFIEHAKCQRVT